jgi:hypothetical protein
MASPDFPDFSPDFRFTQIYKYGVPRFTHKYGVPRFTPDLHRFTDLYCFLLYNSRTIAPMAVNAAFWGFAGCFASIAAYDTSCIHQNCSLN